MLAISITLSRQPDAAKSCNCSFCDRTGAVWAYFQPGEISVEEADKVLRLLAAHYRMA